MAQSNLEQMAMLPALEPPPGVTSDFTTRYTGLQPVFIAVVSVWLLLITAVVAARVIAKGLGMRLMQMEDCWYLLCPVERVF